MKARIPTKYDKFLTLQREEIARINKIWLFALYEIYGFGNERLRKVYEEVCRLSEKAFDIPEIWYHVDQLLINKYDMTFFEPEDLKEREDAVAQKHKDAGIKWRKY